MASTVTEAAARSLSSVLEHAFEDMLRLLQTRNDLVTRPLDKKAVETKALQSVMFTIASSSFRTVVLLHVHTLNKLPDAALGHFGCAERKDSVYQDYVSELGNNLCGVICRLYGEAGLSTGMSTPIVLGNRDSTGYFRTLAPDYETHVGTQLHGAPLMLASLFVFVNDGQKLDLQISLAASADTAAESGELEFF